MTAMRQDVADVEVREQVPRVMPMLEVGKSGLRRTSGYIDEEFLPQLRGRKAVQIFKEMSSNDPIIGALLFAIDRLIRQIEYRVEPASDSPEDRQNAELLEQNMQDMSHTWDDLISEILTMVPYGWAFCEITYKRRIGPWENDPKKRSKYTDGLIGWRKISLRAQETLDHWIFDDDGGLKAMVQISPPNYQQVTIPIEKALLFRTNAIKGNPEGVSMLRTSYRPWFLKKRIEEHEGIGVERDLAGMPMARVPARHFDAKAGSKEALMLKSFQKLVRSVRRDEQDGIVIPSELDIDGKSPLYNFELLSSSGSRQFDTSAIIERYEQRMLMSVLADFILVGHEGVGSYSMHTDKTGLFRTAINSIAQSIADVFNRYAVPRLFSINGMKPDSLPTIVPNNVDPPDLTQLGAFMTSMTQAGMTWFPDPDLEAFIRDAANLPKMTPEEEAVEQMKMRQQNMMDLATQRMQSLDMEIQAQQGVMGLAQTKQSMDQTNQTMDQTHMGMQQQAGQMQDEQAQREATARGEQPEDPTMPHKVAQEKSKADQQNIGTEKAKIGLNTEKVRQKQAEQTLRNLKDKPKPAGPGAKPKPKGKVVPKKKGGSGGRSR